MNKKYIILNKWTVLILGIWTLSSITASITGNCDAVQYAFYATLLIGAGYMILQA